MGIKKGSMRLLKSFVITIVGFLVVITLVSLLMPSNVITTRTVSIAASSAEVMAQVKDLNNWPKWHPLFSNEQTQFNHADQGRAVNWTLHGKENKMQLTSFTDQQVVFDLISAGQNTQQNKISILQYKDSDAVQVEWSALTRLKWYPWEKFSGIFVDKITGAGYEAALNELKNYVERAKKEN